MAVAQLRTNADFAAALSARVAEQRRCASPAMKTLDRMQRLVGRHRVRGYEGYSLHIPKAGDVLMHFNDFKTGQRRSIRILPSGNIEWAE